MIKIIIGIWILGSIFFTPFHYYSGAYDIRPDMQTNYGKGKVFGEAMRWPFYLFMSDLTTGESSIDSQNEKTFNKSLALIVRERIAWGDRNAGIVLINSFGQCVLEEFYLNKILLNSKNLKEITNALYFSKDSKIVDKQTLQTIRKKIMSKFNGYDFSDIINAGVDCKKNISNQKTNNYYSEKIITNTNTNTKSNKNITSTTKKNIKPVFIESYEDGVITVLLKSNEQYCTIKLTDKEVEDEIISTTCVWFKNTKTICTKDNKACKTENKISNEISQQFAKARQAMHELQ